MKNFKMKNIILGVLIAVMAIACFAVVGVTLNNVPKYEREQEIHIAGLEFEDGWNLISDAEDYYLMTENTSTGKNAGAKYRLTNDITINPYRAQNGVFVGATFDGCEYNISYEEDPEYLPDNSASQFSTFTDYETYGLDHTLPWSDGSRLMAGTFVGNAGMDCTPNEFDINETNWKGGAINIQAGQTIDLTGMDDSKVYCIGGVYGIVVNAKIANLRVNFSGYFEYEKIRIIANGYDVAVGGIAGYVHSSSITKCLVDCSSGCGFEMVVDDYYMTQEVYMGGIAGVGMYVYNSGLSDCISNNIVIGLGALMNSDTGYGHIASGWHTFDYGGHHYKEHCATLERYDTYAEDLPSLERQGLIENVAYSSIDFYTMDTIDWVYRSLAFNSDRIETYWDIIIQHANWEEELAQVGFMANKWGMEYGEDDDLYLLDVEQEGYAGIYALKECFGDVKPKDPEIPGYVFKGWSYEMDYFVPISDDVAVRDLVLYNDNVRWVYAYFEPIEYTIVYHSDKVNTSGLEPTSFNREMEGPIKLPVVEFTGYEFAGWETKGGNIYYDFDEYGNMYYGFKAYDETILNDVDSNKQLHLYAKFVERAYQILLYPINMMLLKGDSLVDAGYEIGNMDAVELEKDGQYYYTYYSTEQGITLPKPTREGYKFIGWVDNLGNIVNSVPRGTTGNLIFDARWRKLIDVTLDYNFNDSPGKEVDPGELENLSYGDTYSKNLNITKPGYDFQGWTTDYLDIGKFIEWYTKDKAKDISKTKPYVTDEGWLALSGPMAWDGNSYWGYPIYLTNGTYKLSMKGYGEYLYNDKGEPVGYGGSLSLVATEDATNYKVSGKFNEQGVQYVAVRINDTQNNDTEISKTFTVNDMSGGVQFCLFHSYNTESDVYYKDIRITKLNDDGTEAKYQGIQKDPDNGLHTYTSESDVTIPYDHTLYANWSEELDVIELHSKDGVSYSYNSRTGEPISPTTGSDGTKFPILSNSDKYGKFLGWRLDTECKDLDGNVLGDGIWFELTGRTPSTFKMGITDGNCYLYGFDPTRSGGYARLLAVFEEDDSKPNPIPTVGPKPFFDPTIPDPLPETGNNNGGDGDFNYYIVWLVLGDEQCEVKYILDNDTITFNKDANISSIYYTSESSFHLPKSEEIKCYGYTLTGWKMKQWRDGWKDHTTHEDGLYKPGAQISGVTQDVILYAVWKENVYKVEIHSNVPDNDAVAEKTIYKHTENIELSLNELFSDLKYNADYNDDGILDYRFVGWTIGDRNSGLGYAEINSRYGKTGNSKNNDTSGNVANTFNQLFINWGKVSVDDTYFPIIFKDVTEVSKLIHGYADDESAESGYWIQIYAVWTPVYKVTIQANMDGDNHNCGDGECACGIYDSGKKTTAISGDASTYIVPQNEQYNFGETTVTQTIKTQHYFKGYEIPGFDFEHVFNKPGNNEFGLHYYGHEIYGWKITVDSSTDKYVLKYRTDEKGNVLVKNGKPVVEDGTQLSHWLKIANSTTMLQHQDYNDVYYVNIEGKNVYCVDLIPDKIDLKCLQGDIILIPQWRPVVFDVVFKTANGQGYKNNYEDKFQESQITFGSTYLTRQSAVPTTGEGENKKLNGSIGTLYATDIYGYTVIYEHPYNAINVDSSKYITTTGTWDYMLKYKTYPEGKDSPYGNKFYIEIEGYYAPDLYRVKIDLDLPYTDNNNFNVVCNGFVEGTTLGDSKYTMSPYVKYDSETYSVDKYVLVYVENEPKYMYEKTGYQNYQHKLIKVTEVGKDVYYIYLLQDQVVGYDENQKCAYIENAYYNGKVAESNKKSTTYLPTFEIDYYEMQYYYAIGSTTINLYKTAKLDDYQTDLAKQKLSKKYEFDNKEETFPYVSDWKESYNINNTNPIIYIYWYRNILNLDIYNMINPNDSDDAKDQTTVGYVLVTENEQVTLEQGLIDHKQYHLVIYAYNNGQLGYVVYEFNDISVLENSDFYKYIQLLGKNNNHLTLEALKELSTIDNVNILESNKINNKGKYIPIYFGNSVTIEAVDQGKDQSLDEFIGYRFRNFEYVENCDNITSIDKFKVDEGNPNQVIIDLRDYEHGKDFTDDGIDNPNTTNYFEDQDVLTIKAHFEPIKYKFNYQTVNESYEYYPQAGNIQLNYEGTSVNGMRAETVSSKFAYYVNVNAIGSNTSIRNYMNIELGYEHLDWYIYKNVYSQNTTNLLIKTGDTQEFIFKVDAEFLRTYYGGNYTTDLVQDIYGYSECKLMEFKIQVHVIDVSTNTNAREPYELSTSDELFTISSYPLTLNDKTPSNNNYTITMLKGAEGYTFVTYVYGGKAYILQELYIKTAGSSMTIKDFMTMYPARSLGQYDINITSGLLGQAIINTQYVELEEDDRVLHFYIDVAPVITMAFEVVESGDKNLSDRTLMIGSETIAKGSEGEDFKVEVTSDGEESTYVGYWGQNILLTFIAGNHYRSIDFEIEYVDESQKEKIDQLSIIPGNNKIYTLKGNSTAKIKIVPNTYDLTAYISYNGNRYEISEYEIITNAVGDNIFKSVEIIAHEDNISQAGMYYTGDKFEITYELNPEVLKDITIEVLENGDTVDMYDDDGNGVADGSIEFSNVGIELEIRVQDKVQAVILKSNYQDKHAADIRAKVNGGDWTLVQDDTGRKNVIFSLVRGDVLTVYVKEQVGFSFDKTYSYGFVGGTVETEEFDGGWLFTLFADGGFTAEDNGTYTLNFTQIPFEVEFKHYLTTEAIELEGSEIPSECIATKDMSDNERYIQLGSKVKLNKSVDKTGYRFNGYTYVAPQGQELAIELEDEFIVNKTMLQHLATVGTNKKGNVPIVIYLNYVKQHTFNISAKGATVQILDESDKEINPSKYYDFGTKFKVKAKAIDSEHYQIKASINGTEVSQENQDDVAISGKTNLGNLSNFTTVEYTLNNDYTILVEVVAEKYSIRLFQELNNGEDVEKDDKELATQSTWFKLSDNVYYQALGTFGYNTEVDIQIFVANPQVDESTYYVLNKVSVDGREVSVKAGNKSTVYGKQGVTYTIEHTMLGEPPEGSAITSEITITFNAMYYVTVIQ